MNNSFDKSVPMAKLRFYICSLKKLMTMPAPIAIKKIAIFAGAVLTKQIDRIITVILGGEISRFRFACSFKSDIATSLEDFRNRNEAPFLLGANADITAFFGNGTRQIILKQAEEICQHKFFIFGQKFFVGEEIDWHQDFTNGYRWPKQKYYQDITIPYNQGDIKFPRELSRFQHLILLGLAYRLTNADKYAAEFKAQILQWITSNPFKKGVNWQCTMDVAIRAANWLVGWEFFRQAPQLDDAFVYRFAKSLLEHALFIRSNLEYYQGLTGNHYLADLAGLYVIAYMMPQFKKSRQWLCFCRQELEKEITKQVYADGTVFEASSCYHRLSLELFFYPAFLARRTGACFSANYLRILNKLFDACVYLIKPDGSMPQIGDNDSGQFLKLYRRPVTDMRYLLAIGAVFFSEPRWKIATFFTSAKDITEIILLYGPQGVDEWNSFSSRSLDGISSKQFADSGWYVLRHQGDYCLCCCGPNGQYGNGGHAHNDKLSLIMAIDSQDVLVDPGTFIYTSLPCIRNRFRSTRYHNTISINGQEQNRWDTESVFPLRNDAHASEVTWQSDRHRDFFVGEHYGYQNYRPPVVHRRQLLFSKNDGCWCCQDSLKGEGRITFWLGLHFAPQLRPQIAGNVIAVKLADSQTISIQFPLGEKIDLEAYCYSNEYGVKQQAKAVFLHKFVTLPYSLDWKIYKHVAAPF